MRPGKPLLFGRIGSQRVIGVPGNPVSSLICTRLFAAPLIARLKGEPALGGLETRLVPLARDLPANGPREHYMRAHLTVGPDGCERIEAAASQDSSRIRLLSQSTHLIVRKPNAAAAASGTSVPVARIDF